MEPMEAFFVKISSQARQNIAVDDKGRLFTWGANRFGSLGFENFNAVNNPLWLSSIKDYKVCLKIKKSISIISLRNLIAINSN
jgi:alpha-tubulin suppressor-like RCC1 family protein